MKWSGDLEIEGEGAGITTVIGRVVVCGDLGNNVRGLGVVVSELVAE